MQKGERQSTYGQAAVGRRCRIDPRADCGTSVIWLLCTQNEDRRICDFRLLLSSRFFLPGFRPIAVALIFSERKLITCDAGAEVFAVLATRQNPGQFLLLHILGCTSLQLTFCKDCYHELVKLMR